MWSQLASLEFAMCCIVNNETNCVIKSSFDTWFLEKWMKKNVCIEGKRYCWLKMQFSFRCFNWTKLTELMVGRKCIPHFFIRFDNNYIGQVMVQMMGLFKKIYLKLMWANKCFTWTSLLAICLHRSHMDHHEVTFSFFFFI